MLNKYSFLNTKKEVKKISTGIRDIDRCIGGGLPNGKIVEIVGQSDVGKTRLLFDLIESFSKEELITLYVSTTRKSLNFLINRDINREKVVMLVSNDASVITKTIQSMTKLIDVLIIDSIATILTSNEIGGFDMNQYQDLPKLMSDIDTIIYGENISTIIVNHLTIKDGISVSRWRNIFNKYCSIRVLINEYSEQIRDIEILSHKNEPNLIGGSRIELRMGENRLQA